jgi:hypothetical protein
MVQHWIVMQEIVGLTSVPFRPTTVQVSNKALVETETDNSVYSC